MSCQCATRQGIKEHGRILKTDKMDWDKIQMMTEQNMLYLLLKDCGLTISLEQFKALCDKAKKAADKAVEQEQKRQGQ